MTIITSVFTEITEPTAIEILLTYPRIGATIGTIFWLPPDKTTWPRATVWLAETSSPKSTSMEIMVKSTSS